MEITIKVTNFAETGVGFVLYVDGKEHTNASVGEFEKETYKHMCNLMGVSVYGLLSNYMTDGSED